MSYIGRIGHAPALALAVSAMVGVSACGGSTKAGSGATASAKSQSAATTTTSTTESATSSSRAQASTPQSKEAKLLKAVHCMHGYGIDIPLQHTGHGLAANLKGIDTSTPRYQKFEAKCLRRAYAS